MVNVLLKLAVQRGAETTAPSLSLLHVLDYSVSVWASLAAMGRLVVLIEGVGSPKALVAVGARVFAPSLMEFFLVAFPVEFALECLVARRAPELAI